MNRGHRIKELPQGDGKKEIKWTRAEKIINPRLRMSSNELKIKTNHCVRKSFHLKVEYNLNSSKTARAQFIRSQKSPTGSKRRNYRVNLPFIPTTWIFQVENDGRGDGWITFSGYLAALIFRGRNRYIQYTLCIVEELVGKPDKLHLNDSITTTGQEIARKKRSVNHFYF